MNCKKCWMYKATDKSKCCCNATKFNADKLSKKTRKEKAPTPIKQVSDKKAAERKTRWSFLQHYAKLAKWHFDSHWDGTCMYCWSKFNIETDFVDNRVAFAHILAKWDPLYKHLAMFKNNIAIVCSETCHKDMDSEICVLWIKPDLKIKIEWGETIDVKNLSSYL